MATAAQPLNQPELDFERRLLRDLPLFAKHNLRIRTKDGTVKPLVLNRAQLYLHERLEAQLARKGRVRAIIVKGRQQGCCLDPNTRVLTASLEWVPIKDIEVGQELVATDEHTTPGLGKGKGTRQMRTSTVEKIWRTRRVAYRMTFDDGRSVVCSDKHRWLSKKSQDYAVWRSIGGSGKPGSTDGRDALKVGDQVRSITTVWGDRDFEDAWYGGVLDGEGSFDYARRTGADMAVSQCDGPVLDRMLAYCDSRQFGYCVVSDDGPRKTKYGQRPVRAISMGSMAALFRLIGLTRPTRFLGLRWWEGKRLPDNCWRRIVSIEELGVQSLVDIQTSTQTYVAEGLVSHNSTYTEARYYHKTIRGFGLRAFILTHEADATSNLFEMVERFHSLNDPHFRPATGATNARELIFSGLDSGYKVGTAGAKGTGRSGTVQLFHGSECAFWPNAQEHAAGVLQSVPNALGTEIILESTARGLGNFFHQQTLKALSGQSEYEVIFIPWYWQPEYTLSLGGQGIFLDEEETQYRETYGLTLEQMAWRRAKIADLNDPKLFKQEYPATIEEAFQATGIDSYIPADMVQRARKNEQARGVGPVVAGFDPKRDGGDRASFIYRQGSLAWGLEYNMTRDFNQTLGYLQAKLDVQVPYIDKLFIDYGGSGWELGQMLKERGYGDRVVIVNFGSGALNDLVYANRRAEMWGAMKGWICDPDVPPAIPDDEALVTDISAPTFDYDSRTRYLLEPKAKMKARLGLSPDGGDCLALTFAEPVVSRQQESRAKTEYDVVTYGMPQRQPKKEYNPATYSV